MTRDCLQDPGEFRRVIAAQLKEIARLEGEEG
jgi:hypothetical protein